MLHACLRLVTCAWKLSQTHACYTEHECYIVYMHARRYKWNLHVTCANANVNALFHLNYEMPYNMLVICTIFCIWIYVVTATLSLKFRNRSSNLKTAA